MSFGIPLALLGLIPVVAVALLLWRRAPMLLSALPGGWARIIGPELTDYMARGLSRPGLGQAWLCIAAAGIVVLAIARPLVPLGGGIDYANLAGRVIVLDAISDGIEDRRITVDRILELSPDVPTSLVALSSDAYTIVPFTTDRAQIDRYLRVLDADVIPDPGLSMHTGIAHAEKVLADAGVVAAQMVMIFGGDAPPRVLDIPETDTLRWFVVPEASDRWERFANGYQAEITNGSTVEPLVDDMSLALEALRGSLPGAAADFSPWLYALAMVLWLGLFRRRSAP